MRSLRMLGLMVIFSTQLYAQDSIKGLEIKPGIGITGSPFKSTVAVLVAYPLTNRWSVASHTLLSFLLVRSPKERYIKTNYNYSVIQTAGIGYSLYSKNRRSAHTIRLMGGVKQVAFSETLDNPGLDEKVTTSVRTIVPEYGGMYDFSFIRKRYSFTTRLYLPMHPLQYYPKGSLNNLAYLEIGVGIKLKKNKQ